MCTFIIFAFTNHLSPSLPYDLPPPSPSTGPSSFGCELHLGVRPRGYLRISKDIQGYVRISKDISGYLWRFRISFLDVSSKDIFLRYPEISLRYPYNILNRYPPSISFTDIYVYPELSYDIPLISQSDILVISLDIFFNILSSYLMDILRYPYDIQCLYPCVIHMISM